MAHDDVLEHVEEIVAESGLLLIDTNLFQAGRRRILRVLVDKVGKVGEILRQYPQTIIETAGYTDSRGGFDYNMKLSRERAKNVADRLYASGIQNHSFVTGCSLQNPLAPNTSSQNMALNRRVEVYLYPSNNVRTDVCR